MAEDSKSGVPTDDAARGYGDPKERLAAEMRAALKAGEKIKLGALRLLSASVKNREVELRHPLNDEEFVQVAMREVKRRKEAIEAFSGAGRDDSRRSAVRGAMTWWPRRAKSGGSSSPTCPRRSERTSLLRWSRRRYRRRPRRVRETWGRSWAMSWARPEEGWTERKCRPECESA